MASASSWSGRQSTSASAMALSRASWVPSPSLSMGVKSAATSVGSGRDAVAVSCEDRSAERRLDAVQEAVAVLVGFGVEALALEAGALGAVLGAAAERAQGAAGLGFVAAGAEEECACDEVREARAHAPRWGLVGLVSTWRGARCGLGWHGHARSGACATC